MSSPMLTSALAYAAAGYPVFPCGKNKKPIIPKTAGGRGYKDATTDLDQIRIWWTRWPHAMIGMPTGAITNITGVDYDRNPAWRPKGRLPKVKTPRGGDHSFFDWESNKLRNSEDQGNSNIDVRGAGGYVILPPSQNGAGPYRWVGPLRLKDAGPMPPELLTALEDRLRHRNGRNPSGAGNGLGKPGSHGLYRDPSTIQGGERHPELMSLAGGLWNLGHASDEIEQRLWAHNALIPDPLPKNREHEIPKMIEWLEREVGNLELEFWSATPILAHIRLHAQANRASPLAFLGCVLARVCAATHYQIQLPGLGSGDNAGSLNSFFMLVGDPGSGKDQALEGSRAAIALPDDVDAVRFGSGEGLAHVYKDRAKKDQIPDDQHGEVWLRRAALFAESEVESVLQLAVRRGATLLSELRSTWSGGRLGHEFVDVTKKLHLPAHSYRLAVSIGGQPSMLKPILDDAGAGLPQRFIWLICRDRYAPETLPQSPGVFTAPPDKSFLDPDKPVQIPVFDGATREMDDFARRNLRGEFDGTNVNSHALFAQLKLAAHLMMLHGETTVTEQWWGLAGWLMKRSAEGRMVCVHYSHQEHSRYVKGRADDEARIALHTSEALESRDLQRCRDAVARKLTRKWVPRRVLRDALSANIRSYIDEVMDKLVEDGKAERRTRTPDGGGSVSVEYRKRARKRKGG